MPIYSCPGTGVPAGPYYNPGTNSWGCIGELVQLTTAYGIFVDHYTMHAELNDNSSSYNPHYWSDRADNFHDNNGGSWGGTVGSADFWGGDAQGYWTDQTFSDSTGDFVAIGPGLVLGDLFRDLNETVHIGLKATINPNYPGYETFCYFAEFKPEAPGNEYGTSGQCASP